MVNLVFWNYKYLHNKIPNFILKDFTDYNAKLLDIITSNHYNLSENKYANIKILKVLKKNPTQLFDDNNPYFNLHLTLNDYMNYYNIKNNHCDIIFELL
jgi:hypothetical protein